MQKTILALSFLSIASFAFAADVDGKWSAMTQGPRGEMGMIFDLKADDDQLTGTVSNEFMGESEITDGKVDGDKVSFKQELQRGNFTKTFAYEGTVSGDELKLTRTRVGGPSGGGPGARGKRGPGGGPGAGGRGGRGGGQGGQVRRGGGMGGPAELVTKRVE